MSVCGKAETVTDCLEFVERRGRRTDEGNGRDIQIKGKKERD